jgi:predicted GIY-YIG superfamily endonuclease
MSRYNQNKSTSSKQYYAYSLNLANGNKYVGITSNPEKRLSDHFSGNGAKWTQVHKPTSVNSINPCKSLESAKNAERIMYYNMKNYHGSEKVRGAGNTKSY